MSSATQAAIAAARDANERLLALFLIMGVGESPQGMIPAAYRTARAALAGNLDDLATVSAALLTLQSSFYAAATLLLSQAAQVGMGQAQAEIEAYGLARGNTQPPNAQPILAAWLAVLMQQMEAVRTFVLIGAADEGEILGDGVRRGILTEGPVLREGARWLATTAQTAYEREIERATEGQPGVWARVAVATLDNRTTECCRLVHGQVRPFGVPFTLTGTPRFADEMEGPPFHPWCRTREALVPIGEDADAMREILEMEAVGIAPTNGAKELAG